MVVEKGWGKEREEGGGKIEVIGGGGESSSGRSGKDKDPQPVLMGVLKMPGQ